MVRDVFLDFFFVLEKLGIVVVFKWRAVEVVVGVRELKVWDGKILFEGV